MKKMIFGLMTLLFLLTSSCKKENNINNGGNWSFKGTNFNAMGCDAFQGIPGPLGYESFISAGTSTASDNVIEIVFGSYRLPDSSGTYTVVDGNAYPIGNQVAITLTLGQSNSTGLGGTVYASTGGNGSNQSVYVSVSSARKISVSGTGIMMRNDTLATDSAALTLDIAQTN